MFNLGHIAHTMPARTKSSASQPSWRLESGVQARLEVGFDIGLEVGPEVGTCAPEAGLGASYLIDNAAFFLLVADRLPEARAPYS